MFFRDHIGRCAANPKRGRCCGCQPSCRAAGFVRCKPHCHSLPYKKNTKTRATTKSCAREITAQKIETTQGKTAGALKERANSFGTPRQTRRRKRLKGKMREHPTLVRCRFFTVSYSVGTAAPVWWSADKGQAGQKPERPSGRRLPYPG